MDFLTSIPAEFRTLASIVFVTVLSVGAAMAYLRGKKEGPPKSSEFALSGQLADMGPVKELVAQAGLLVQQQVRTNLALEEVASAVTHLTEAYEAQIEAKRDAEKIEDEVNRQVDKQLRLMRQRQSRAPKSSA